MVTFSALGHFISPLGCHLVLHEKFTLRGVDTETEKKHLNKISVLIVVPIFSQSVSLTQYVVLSVRLPVRLFQLAYCLNDQAHFA